VRRRLTAALVAAVLGTTGLTLLPPAAAQAAPDVGPQSFVPSGPPTQAPAGPAKSPDGAPPPGTTETLSVTSRGAAGALSQRSALSADPLEGARERAATSGNAIPFDATTAAETPLLAAVAPPAQPDPADAAACLASSGGVAGRVDDRMHWCNVLEIVHVTLEDDVPVGFTHVQLLVLGYGRDDGNRTLTVFGRPLSVVFDGVDTPATPMTLRFTCRGDPGCVDATPVAATLGQWLEQVVSPVWSRWTMSSDASQSTRTDRQSYDVFEVIAAFPGAIADSPEFGFRCDSASYIPNRPAGCVFTDAMTYLQYARFDAAGNPTNQKSVAEHIRQAQDAPDTTDPLPAPGTSKNIPGKFTGVRDERFLTRVPTGGAAQRRNRAAKDRACALIPTPTNIVRPQCDEYPFQSTLQGAGSAAWDFSIKYVPGAENGSAGTGLRTFYEQNRILYDSDRFWVQIVDRQGQGSGLPTGPSVDAGPDVNGDEGSPIALHGSAGDGTTLGWTYAPVGTVDAGTSCSFSDATRADPTFTCDDDGLFQLTLTATDGAGLSASDVVFARVRNAPPRVSIAGVASWDVFRVGHAIVAHAPFTDAANDTHTCRWFWDDASDWEASFEPRAPYDCGEVHGFEHPGMYTITVEVTDDDGGVGRATVMLVVYDPRVGSANIDGSTATPAGAWVDGPSTPGGTWVHYTGQYPPGGDTPYGQAKAWIDSTGFRLEPTGMAWLVLTPDGKVASRGTGTVGGRSGYSWLLYGWDACDGSNAGHCIAQSVGDTVRLVVFESATGRIVYDHSPGETEFDVDRINLRPLTSGGVQVHLFPF
jgi:hypothetical protein